MPLTLFTATALNPQKSPKPYFRPQEPEAKDTFITSNSDVNWETDQNLKVGHSLTLGRERALLEFDLSSMSPNATISKAELTLWYKTEGIAPSTINIYRLLGSWDEAGVKWSNAPLYDHSPVATATLTPGAPAFYLSRLGSNGLEYWYGVTWDITSLVSDWVDGTYTNSGLMLMAPDAEANALGGEWIFYSSSKSSETNPYKVVLRPIFHLEYFDPDVDATVLDGASFCLRCHDGSPPTGVTVPEQITNIALTYLTTSPHGAGHEF